MARIFTGDLTSGTFNQWRRVITQYGGYDGIDYPEFSVYSAAIKPMDAESGYQARFEVREGDTPTVLGVVDDTERSEVMGYGDETGGGWAELGTTRWYAFSVKFDSTFPANQYQLNWANIAQWKPYLRNGADYDAPVLSWGWHLPDVAGMQAGYFYLIQQQAVAQAAPLPTSRQNPIRILALPLNLGQWHDIKMQIKLKTDATGFVRVWWNGDRQTLTLPNNPGYSRTLSDNDQTFNGQTAPPPSIGVSETDHGVAMHLGLYRGGPTTPTGIVYHANYRMADSEDSL